MCPPGSFASQNGTGACTKCSTGQFQTNSGQARCHVCTEYYRDEKLTSNEDNTGCVLNDALLQLTMIEAFYYNGVALSGAFSVTLGFVAVAAMKQLVREKTPSLAKLTRIEMVINSAFPGFSFGSELFLVFGMWVEDPGLGVTMFLFRLLHMVGGILLLVATYGKKRLATSLNFIVRDASTLRDRIDDSFSSKNTYFVACITLLGLCDITMLQFLPWKASRFYTLSEGFPSPGVMKLSLVVKTVQSAVSVICQITYLARTSDLSDPTTTAQAKALFGLNIIVSLVGVFLWFLLWVLKGGRLLKAADDGTDGLDAEKGTGGGESNGVTDPSLDELYKSKDNSELTVNPLHDKNNVKFAQNVEEGKMGNSIDDVLLNTMNAPGFSSESEMIEMVEKESKPRKATELSVDGL